MTKYILTREQLLELLTSHNKLIALESGGVDNWGWYGASIRDFINEWIREEGVNPDEDWYIDDIADSYDRLMDSIISTHQPIILLTTDLFRELTVMTVTRLMLLLSAAKVSTR